jgi:hypothetical protein
MSVTIPENIKGELMKLIEAGDEAKAREFVLAHIKEFSQDDQDALIVSFLEEALNKKMANDSALSNFRKEGLAAVKELADANDELEKMAKMADIKEGI